MVRSTVSGVAVISGAFGLFFLRTMIAVLIGNPLPFGLLELGADANVRLEYHAMRILSHDKYDVLIHAHADAAMSKHYQR